MTYQDTVILKKYVPVYRIGKLGILEGDSYDSEEQAEEEIQDRARDMFWDRYEKFDYAEVKVKYVPEEVWDEN